MKPKTAVPSPAVQNALGKRLRACRVERGMSLRDAAAALKWSFGRLQSYETGETSPSVEEIVAASELYAVDKVELAFGRTDGGKLGQDSSASMMATAVIATDEGVSLTVPSSILRGSLPPFRGTVLTGGSLGSRAGDVAIYRPGALAGSGLHVAVVAGTSQLVMGMARSGKKTTWLVDYDTPVPHSAVEIKGSVVAMLRFVASP